MKRSFILAVLVFAIAALTTESAYAARIYNFLPLKIYVTGLVGIIKSDQILMAPGNKNTGLRSDSLSWSSADGVRVDPAADGYKSVSYSYGNTPLCRVVTFPHRQMQGGNYMTIGYRGKDIVCTICDSNHKVLDQKITPSYYTWTDASRTGC